MFEDQIAKLPSQPPRDPALLPGLTLSAAISKKLLLPVIFLAFFALIPFSIIRSESRSRLTSRNGKVADGQVVSIAAIPGSQDDRQITYAFTPPGSPEYRGSCRCSKGSAYYDLKPGDHVPVAYLPTNPALNTLGSAANEKNEPPLFIFMFFPLIAVFIFAPMLAPQISELFKARRLFKNGRIGVGSVLFIKRKPNPMMSHYAVSPAETFILYRPTSGQEVEGKALCNNDWLISHLPPGAAVHIAYSEEKPGEIALLDAYIR